MVAWKNEAGGVNNQYVGIMVTQTVEKEFVTRYGNLFNYRYIQIKVNTK